MSTNPKKKPQKKTNSFHEEKDYLLLKNPPNIYIRIRPVLFYERHKFDYPGSRVLDSFSLFIRKCPQNIKQELIELKPKDIFNFDAIFPDSKDFSEIMDLILKSHPISEIFQGSNLAFFCYGPPKSGKTYAIFGHEKTGLFYTYLRNLFSSKTQNISIFLKFYQYDNFGFRDLFRYSEFKLKPLQIGFNGKVIGVSRYLINDFEESVEFIDVALENHKKCGKGHLIIEIEIEIPQKNKKNIKSAINFIEFECERQESFENLKKMLKEMKKDNTEFKLLSFFRQFDDFNDFIYNLVRKDNLNLVFLGCLDNLLFKIDEKIETLEFLREMKEISLNHNKINTEIENFFIEKELEKRLILIKKSLADQKNDETSFFFLQMQEFFHHLRFFTKTEIEFQISCSKLLQNNEKISKQFCCLSKEEKEQENYKIGAMVRNMNDAFFAIKTLKGKIQKKYFKSGKFEEFFPKMSSLFRFIPKHTEDIDCEKVLLSVFQEKSYFLPKIKITNEKNGKMASLGKIESLKKGENFPKDSSFNILEKIENSHIFEENKKRESSLNIFVKKAKSRVQSEQKIVRLRNHKIILNKLAGKNGGNKELMQKFHEDVGMIAGKGNEKKRRSQSFALFNNNSFNFKVE